MCRLRRGFLRDAWGSAATEFALLVPVFALLVLGIFHFCALVYSAACLHWSVEQAARCAAVSHVNTGLGCGTTMASTQTYAGSIYQGPKISPSFTAATDTTNSCRRVSGSGTYRITTGFLNVDVPLSATACFPADTSVTWAAS